MDSEVRSLNTALAQKQAVEAMSRAGHHLRTVPREYYAENFPQSLRRDVNSSIPELLFAKCMFECNVSDRGHSKAQELIGSVQP